MLQVSRAHESSPAPPAPLPLPDRPCLSQGHARAAVAARHPRCIQHVCAKLAPPAAADTFDDFGQMEMLDIDDHDLVRVPAQSEVSLYLCQFLTAVPPGHLARGPPSRVSERCRCCLCSSSSLRAALRTTAPAWLMPPKAATPIRCSRRCSAAATVPDSWTRVLASWCACCTLPLRRVGPHTRVRHLGRQRHGPRARLAPLAHRIPRSPSRGLDRSPATSPKPQAQRALPARTHACPAAPRRDRSQRCIAISW